MFEFPSSRNAWRLDIVSILAVLGESNIKIHSQAITASKLCLLPRLLPAPQGLLRETRPKRLPYVEEVTVYGVQSGIKRDGLNFIPNLFHRIENLPPHTVQVMTIEERAENEGPAVVFSTLAPLNLLAIASCLLSIGLVVWSILVRDGVAFIGIVLISFASSALGYASYWRQLLPNQRPDLDVPRDNVVLHTRWGAFVVVRCTNKVMRDLYLRSEECRYSSSNSTARLFGGVIGGLMVLTAVVLFANCSSWAMQAAIGTSYAFLNVAYWLVGLIPESWSWDLRGYVVRGEQEVEYQKGLHNYTEAVSAVIKLTRSASWVRESQLLPKTEVWTRWLEMAENSLDDDLWHPTEAFRVCIHENNLYKIA